MIYNIETGVTYIFDFYSYILLYVYNGVVGL